MMKATLVMVMLLGLLIYGNMFVAGRGQDTEPKKFDEFSNANWEDMMARLDNFAISLQNDPNAVGFYVVYGGQNRRRYEPDGWAACIKDYLTKRRGIDPTRQAYVLAGYREQPTIELWLGSDKNHIPKAAPTIKPKDVKFSGTDVKKWQELCGL